VCYNPCPAGYFKNSNGTNCTLCSAYCAVCVDPFDLCTECTLSGTYKAYLLNTTGLSGSCGRTCPSGYYAENYAGAGPNLCLACDASCAACTGSPTPCSLCNATYYLYNAACLSTCPSGYFAYNSPSTGLCLNCDSYCVGLTVDMYHPTVLNVRTYIDMSFTQFLNFSTFDMAAFQTISISAAEGSYSLSMFNITYQQLSRSSYRIIIEPLGYIFLYNATFTVRTRAEGGVLDYAENGYPFKLTNYGVSAELSWFLIKGPPFSSLETNIMTSFNTLSTKTNKFLANPYIQEIKKSGIFLLLFSGAQITSCSMLSNQIQSQNLYEGVRFWAVFVFFDAPQYEQISNQTKRFVVPTVEDQIRNAQEAGRPRELFSTDDMYWRFQRTGQTSFFIYDCYVPVLLIALCWTLLLVAHKCKHRRWYPRHAAKIFSATHKVHEISLMYITMASIVEFIYFKPSSAQRVISAALCALFNVYFVVYELYLYYDMLRYPLAEIGNALYDYYVVRYGSFLKNVRYEEYNVPSLLLRCPSPGRCGTGCGPTTSTSSPTTRSTS
jgi:hypothetical protein